MLKIFKSNIVSLTLLNINLILCGTTGKLVGTVKDQETLEPLIGCNIVVDGTYLGASTDQNGEFIILNIPPGKYKVRSEMIGYKNLVQEDVSISIDKTTRLSISLVATIIEGEMVTVQAERKLIQ